MNTKTNTMFLQKKLLATLLSVWTASNLVVQVASAHDNADYLPSIVQPYDSNHRALLEKSPNHICIQGKKTNLHEKNKGKQCHQLLAGHSRDMDTGRYVAFFGLLYPANVPQIPLLSRRHNTADNGFSLTHPFLFFNFQSVCRTR